jgi:hypothetical protein
MPSDNSFRKALDLGAFSSTQPLRGSNVIGPDDKVDFVKFSLAPNPGFSARASFNAKGGKLTAALFFRNPLNGAFTPVSTPLRLKAGKSSSDFQLPATNIPLDLFIRFDRPTQEVNYRFSIKALG